MLYLAGCAAIATAAIYVAFVVNNGTQLGRWTNPSAALSAVMLLATPALLLPAAIFAWLHAVRTWRSARPTRRTFRITALTALFAIVMAIGHPRSEAVVLAAHHLLLPGA